MLDTSENAVPKVHPASREILPDDPMEMQAHELPGDVDLMIRMMVEEYTRLGWNVDDLMRLARDPNYFAFHAMYCRFGEDDLRRRFESIVARCGVMRVNFAESIPLSEQLVQIDLPN